MCYDVLVISLPIQHNERARKDLNRPSRLLVEAPAPYTDRFSGRMARYGSRTSLGRGLAEARN